MLRNHIVLRLRAKDWTWARINTFLYAMALPQIAKVDQGEGKDLIHYVDSATANAMRAKKKARVQATKRKRFQTN